MVAKLRAPRVEKKNTESKAQQKKGFKKSVRPTKSKKKAAARPKAHAGSTVEDFLKEEGVYETVTALAVKRVIAWQIEEAMQAKGLSKSDLAKKMKTSRSQLDRLLDPDNDKVQLDTIHRAAHAVGKRVVISLEGAGV